MVIVKKINPANPNLGLAQQGLKKLVNGDVQRLYEVLQSPKIGAADLEAIKQALRFVMVKIGLRERNWPEDDEKIILLRHIIENYSAHTVDEIILAFDMAMTGKLDVEIKCYENFSCEYFSSIMSAYRAWAKEEYKQLPSVPSLIEHKEDMSEQAMEEWLAREIQFIKTGKPFEFLPLELYAYLDKRGEIHATKEEKYAYLEKATAWRQGQLLKEYQSQSSAENLRRIERFRKMRDNGCIRGEEAEKVKNLAKKLLFFDHVLKTY